MADTNDQPPAAAAAAAAAAPDFTKRKLDHDSDLEVAALSPDTKKLKPDDAPASPAAGEAAAALNGIDAAAVKTPVDKGKGILVEVEDSSSSESDGDDDGYDGDELGEEDDDFEDDPLAEVDFSNILPARARRRVVMPGEFVVNDPDGDDGEEDDEDEVVEISDDEEDSD